MLFLKPWVLFLAITLASNKTVIPSPKGCFVSTEQLQEWAELNEKQYLPNPKFEILYDNGNLQPFLVVYKIKFSPQTHVLKRKGDYNDRFRKDKRVIKSAADLDYKRSGWDRGHLAPAKDFSDDKEAASATFLLSNISPQNPDFNRNGSWKKLEETVRKISEIKEVQVLTGPIITAKTTISGEGPTIPTYFFKIIIKEENGECKFLNFIYKNDFNSKEICDRIRENLIPAMISTHLSSAKEIDYCSHNTQEEF